MESNPGTTNQDMTVLDSSPLVSAGRLNRWIASIVDSFLLGLALLPLIFISQLISLGKISLEDTDIEAVSGNPLVIILALLIAGLYKIGYLVKDEATPGKKWRKIKVVQRDGKRIDLLHSSIREISQIIYLIPLLGALLYLISVILVLFSKSRKAIHDYVGGTIVINVIKS